MKLLNVHEIISFDQSDFAKEYISLTTALRTATSSKVKKKMWKFYNNVLFGKSLQDNAKNIDVDIVWNNRRANTKIKSSRFRGRQILDPDTLAISTTPPKISRRMAFAVGFSILEFSKLEMYQVSCTLTASAVPKNSPLRASPEALTKKFLFELEFFPISK